MNRITRQLLKEISNSQEQLAEEKQRNKNLERSLEIEKDFTSILEKEKAKEKMKNVYAFLGGVGFIIILYLFVKICIYFFF